MYRESFKPIFREKYPYPLTVNGPVKKNSPLPSSQECPQRTLGAKLQVLVKEIVYSCQNRLRLCKKDLSFFFKNSTNESLKLVFLSNNMFPGTLLGAGMGDSGLGARLIILLQLGRGQAILWELILQINKQLHGQRTYFRPGTITLTLLFIMGLFFTIYVKKKHIFFSKM